MAYSNIYAFHAAQRTPERIVENMKVCHSNAYSCFWAGGLGRLSLG